MKRNDNEYDAMEGRFKNTRASLSPFFTRKPYEGTTLNLNKHTEEQEQKNELEEEDGE